MSQFQWEDIDHSLISLRMTNLAEEMHAQTNADENRIRFENLGNANDMVVPSLILEMKQKRADEWTRKVYDLAGHPSQGGCDCSRVLAIRKGNEFS